MFKNSKLKISPKTLILADSGYLGITKIHINSFIPKKCSKLKKLTKEDKKFNKSIAKKRIFNEIVIGKLKCFKVLADRYRNRRNRFKIRFNLISAIYNFEYAI